LVEKGLKVSIMVLGFVTCTDTATEPEIGHLPDPSTLSGALDLIAFCFLVILGNVLDFRTYTNGIGEPLEEAGEQDKNGITLEERVNIFQARGVCLELLRWWESNYRVTNPATIYSTGGAALTTRLIVSQAGALLRYKECADKDGREGAPGCTVASLTLQIENVISILPGGPREWERMHNSPSGVDEKLGFDGDDWVNAEVVVREGQNYGEYKDLESFGLDVTPSLEAPTDFLAIGCTRFDREFMGYCSGGQISAGNEGRASAKRVRYR
jgi:hypothetical protein